jgi:hypothetical protein
MFMFPPPNKIAGKARTNFSPSYLKGVMVDEAGVVAAKSIVTRDIERRARIASNLVCLMRKLEPT